MLKKRKLLIIISLALCVLVSSFALGVSFAKGKISGSIRILCWEGYEFAEAFKGFREKYGVTIDPTYIASNDEIFAKLKAGAEYDIVTPNQANIEQLVVNDLLQPIDVSKIPNYKNLDPGILDAMEMFNFEGKVWAVPINFGKNDVVYNADKVGPLESYWDLLKPEWKGRYIMQDEALGAITQAAKATGKKGDPSLLTPEEFAKAKDFLIKLKKGARAIVIAKGEAKSMLISGEVDLQATSGDLMIAKLAKEEGYNLRWNIPKEGTLVFIDSYCIPANAPNAEAAYALCNEVLTANVQHVGVVKNYWGAVTTDVKPLLTEEEKSLYPYDTLVEFFAQSKPNGPLPLEPGKYATMADWIEMWEEVKADP